MKRLDSVARDLPLLQRVAGLPAAPLSTDAVRAIVDAKGEVDLRAPAFAPVRVGDETLPNPAGLRISIEERLRQVDGPRIDLRDAASPTATAAALRAVADFETKRVERLGVHLKEAVSRALNDAAEPARAELASAIERHGLDRNDVAAYLAQAHLERAKIDPAGAEALLRGLGGAFTPRAAELRELERRRLLGDDVWKYVLFDRAFARAEGELRRALDAGVIDRDEHIGAMKRGWLLHLASGEPLLLRGAFEKALQGVELDPTEVSQARAAGLRNHMQESRHAGGTRGYLYHQEREFLDDLRAHAALLSPDELASGVVNYVVGQTHWLHGTWDRPPADEAGDVFLAMLDAAIELLPDRAALRDEVTAGLMDTVARYTEPGSHFDGFRQLLHVVDSLPEGFVPDDKRAPFDAAVASAVGRIAREALAHATAIGYNAFAPELLRSLLKRGAISTADVEGAVHTLLAARLRYPEERRDRDSVVRQLAKLLPDDGAAVRERQAAEATSGKRTARLGTVDLAELLRQPGRLEFVGPEMDALVNGLLEGISPALLSPRSFAAALAKARDGVVEGRHDDKTLLALVDGLVASLVRVVERASGFNGLWNSSWTLS